MPASNLPQNVKLIAILNLTRSQHMALIDLVMEYLLNATEPESRLTTQWVDCSSDPPATTTVTELLQLVSAVPDWKVVKEL